MLHNQHLYDFSIMRTPCITCRVLQDDHDAPNNYSAYFKSDTYSLLEHLLAIFASAFQNKLGYFRAAELCMLTNQECRSASNDILEEPFRAEVTVGYPQFSLMHQSDEFAKERAFLGMTILARKHINDDIPLMIHHNQGFPRQGSTSRFPQRL